MKTEANTCELCGVQTPMLGTKRCDRCWELEKRIKADPGIALKVLSDMHDVSCCGCGLSWSDAHAKGWRTFREDLETYTICPDCRRVTET